MLTAEVRKKTLRNQPATCPGLKKFIDNRFQITRTMKKIQCKDSVRGTTVASEVPIFQIVPKVNRIALSNNRSFVYPDPTCLHLANQHRSTLTHEIDLRTLSELPRWNH